MGIFCNERVLNPESFAHRMRSIWSAICIGEFAAGSGGDPSDDGGKMTPAIRKEIGDDFGEFLGDLFRFVFCFIALLLHTESRRTRDDCTILANVPWDCVNSEGGTFDCGILAMFQSTNNFTNFL